MLERVRRVVTRAGVTMSEVVHEADGLTLLKMPAAPKSPMLNRVLGLGGLSPATSARLDQIAAEMRGLRHFVAVAPDARPGELPDWLRARGYQPGWGWMLFTRGVEDVALRPSTLEIVPVDQSRAPAFARVLVAAYGLPDATISFLERVWLVPDWHCFVSEDQGQVVGAGCLFVADGVGYLGFAATVPGDRGRGSQSALLAARVRHARELGCDVVATQTGERVPDRPSNSYRNILRAGFREEQVTANWLSG